METLWSSANLGRAVSGGGGDKSDKGSVDFSCGNILRCLCFTHEDPNDPGKHLEKIGGHLEEVNKSINKSTNIHLLIKVNKRLREIEKSAGVGLMSRRRSSTGMSRNR